MLSLCAQPGITGLIQSLRCHHKALSLFGKDPLTRFFVAEELLEALAWLDNCSGVIPIRTARAEAPASWCMALAYENVINVSAH
jgi:hypothetical protein